MQFFGLIELKGWTLAATSKYQESARKLSLRPRPATKQSCTNRGGRIGWPVATWHRPWLICWWDCRFPAALGEIINDRASAGCAWQDQVGVGDFRAVVRARGLCHQVCGETAWPSGDDRSYKDVNINKHMKLYTLDETNNAYPGFLMAFMMVMAVGM